MKKVLNLIHELILSFVFAIITVVGNSYKQGNSSKLIFSNAGKTLMLLIFYMIIFLILIIILERVMVLSQKNHSSSFFYKIFDKHPMLFSFIIIMACWLPYIIIKYPGTPGWDFYYYINNYYHFDKTLTQHFPLCYVFLCVYFIKFGLFIGVPNIGLFLLTLFHTVMMCISFSLVFYYLKKWNVNYKLRLFLLIFYAIMPLFPNYATTIYHDTVYSSLILIYVLLLTDLVLNKNLNIKKYIIISIISFCLCLSRKNGIYIVLPTTLVICFKYLYKNKRILKIIILVIPIVLFFISEALFSLKYYKTSYLEAMAIPIQSISRYSKYYHDDITEEEKQKINGVLNYDFSQYMYEPNIVDKNRNNSGNYEASPKQIYEFFITWGKLFFRHPVIYIEAVINTNYPLYYPFINATYTFFEVKEDKNYSTYVNFSKPNFLEEKKDKLKQFNDTLEKIPLIQYINDPGIYSWFLFFMIMMLIKNKKRYLLPLLPLIATFVCCINAPTILYNTRYVFPIIFSIFPLLLFYFAKIFTNDENE